MAERYLGADASTCTAAASISSSRTTRTSARSRSARNGAGTFARIWMHNGFVNFGGGKISKSDESMRVLFKRAFKLRVVIERHGGEALRCFLLTTQYRNPIAFEVMRRGRRRRRRRRCASPASRRPSAAASTPT